MGRVARRGAADRDDLISDPMHAFLAAERDLDRLWDWYGVTLPPLPTAPGWASIRLAPPRPTIVTLSMQN
jgi:hypothetical protein